MSADNVFKVALVVLFSVFVGVYTYNSLNNVGRYYLSSGQDGPARVFDTKTGVFYMRADGKWIIID